ncbi:MAG: zinc ribbon domain-containing protein [Pseudomonadota bacterium]
MPVYDYNCPNCGPFEAFMPMARCKEPVICSACGTEAPRALLTAPALANMATSTRRAHETNERSADGPRRSSDSPPGFGGSRRINSRTVQLPNGSKTAPSARPWMLS